MLTIGCLALVIGLIAACSFQTGVNYYREANVGVGIDVGSHSFHVTAYVQRANESEPHFWSYHTGVLTTIGLNWIEDQLGDSPSTDPAKWISLSVNTGTPSAAWTQIPGEITNGGLGRKAATYATTGDGVWTETYQFTANATHTAVQLVGVQWASTRGSDNNLAWSDTISPVTLNSGDKLTIVATSTVT